MAGDSNTNRISVYNPTGPVEHRLPQLGVLILGLLGLALAMLLIGRAFFGERALANAPPREVMLGPLDAAVALGLVFIGSGVVALLLRALGIDLHNTDPPPTARLYAGIMLLSQLLSQGPVVVYLLMQTRRQPNGWREVGIIPHEPRREAGLALRALGLVVPLVIAVNLTSVALGEVLGQPVPDSGHEMLRIMRESDSLLSTLILLASAVAVAPVLEECIFRGLVQTVLLNFFGRPRRWPVIVVGASIFTVIHAGIMPWQVMPGLFVLGLALGWVYERTGSLLPGILLHAGFNAINSGWTLVVAGRASGS